jgi:hypothetical protein
VLTDSVDFTKLIEKTNASVKYHLLQKWLGCIRTSFYISTDLAELAPVAEDGPIPNNDEILSRFDRHVKSISQKRMEMEKQYTEGILILEKIRDQLDMRSSERKGIQYDLFDLNTSKCISKTLTRESMDKLLEAILSKFERKEDVGTLEIALKNGIANYLGEKTDCYDVNFEIFILKQTLSSIKNIFELMRSICEQREALKVAIIDEVKTGNPKLLEDGIPLEMEIDKHLNSFFPFIDRRAHFDLVDEARQKSYMSMNDVDSISGGLRIINFSNMIPALIAEPGVDDSSAHRAAFMKQISDELNVPLFCIDLPKAFISDENFRKSQLKRSAGAPQSVTANSQGLEAQLLRASEKFGVLHLQDCLGEIPWGKGKDVALNGISTLFYDYRGIDPRSYPSAIVHPATLILFSTKSYGTNPILRNVREYIGPSFLFTKEMISYGYDK